MIVLGADMHKASHTLAAVVATTGEMLGDKTIAVGSGGFAAALGWARDLGPSACGRLRIAGMSPVGSSGSCWTMGSGSFASRRS
jgi:hypothetical protein